MVNECGNLVRSQSGSWLCICLMLLFCLCYDNKKVSWFEDPRCAGRLKISPTPSQGMVEEFLIQISEFMYGHEKRGVNEFPFCVHLVSWDKNNV